MHNSYPDTAEENRYNPDSYYYCNKILLLRMGKKEVFSEKLFSGRKQPVNRIKKGTR